jgi:hypothetical protein
MRRAAARKGSSASLPTFKRSPEGPDITSIKPTKNGTSRQEQGRSPNVLCLLLVRTLVVIGILSWMMRDVVPASRVVQI